MKPFYTTLSYAEDEIIIKKSRFKGFVYSIKDEREAQQKLQELRERFKDATHICYAYVLALNGVVERFSDDGEPSGTAGLPILEAIKSSGYSEVLAIVVRYFGGVKLGAGGLIRAYAESAKSCIQKAQQITFTLSEVYSLSVDFSESKKINQLLSNIVCKTIEINYTSSGVEMMLAVPIDSGFLVQVTDFLSGRLVIEKTGLEYVRF